jgi:hypothetical protein
MKILIAALSLFSVGCTTAKIHLGENVAVDRNGRAVPDVQLRQLGGQMAFNTPGESGDTWIWVNNEKSFTDAKEGLVRVAATVAGGILGAEWLEGEAAKTTTAAATEQAKITAGTQSEQIAADQAIASQKLANEAAAAELAAEVP